MFSNPYINYQQNINDRIDGQIAQLQQMKEQLKNNHQPAINQTFQLAPNSSGMRYANSIDEVNKKTIFGDTPFFSKDLSVVWIKSANGMIKAYEKNKIINKDDKDLQIEYLMSQINELKGMIKHEQSFTNDDTTEISKYTTTNDEPVGESVKKSKSTGVQRISKGKRK